MANNRFNKQVTPKGYKMGGRVSKMGGGMMKRPMYKDGSPKTKQEKNFKITKNNIGKIKEAIKKGKGEAFKGNVKPFKKGGSAKKKKFENPMKKEKAREGMKSQYRKMGFGKLIDDGTIDFSEYKMGGRVKKMGGGSLKPVDKEKNPGLSKLPTKVRNKMGFMKKGGKVK